MDRRSFLRTSALGGAAAASTTLAAPAYAQGNRTLTMVTSVPDGFAIFDDAATDGGPHHHRDDRWRADHQQDARGFARRRVRSVRRRVVRPGRHLPLGRILLPQPAPGLCLLHRRALRHDRCGNGWYYHKGGMELHQELASLFNLKPFLCGNTAMQPGGWFNTEINSAEDLQGLRFRMPGQGGQVLWACSARRCRTSPAARSTRRWPPARSTAPSGSAPSRTSGWASRKSPTIYYTAGFHEPGSALALSTNLDVWESLTPAQQKHRRRSPAKPPTPTTWACPGRKRRRAGPSAGRGRAGPRVPRRRLGCVRPPPPPKSARRTWATRSTRRSPTATSPRWQETSAWYEDRRRRVHPPAQPRERRLIAA
jgi:hypothetical protein